MHWLGIIPGALVGAGLWWFLIKDRQRRRYIARLEQKVKAQLDEQRSKARWN
jgi:hypothetical protein